MERKYIFFDIDGTLTDKKTGKVVESAKYAISKLQEAGHFVAFSTGRANYKSTKLAKELNISHIVSNGGATIMIDNKIVYNEPLDRQLSLDIIKEAENLGYGILVSENNTKEVFMNNEIFIKQMGYRKEPTTYIYDKDRPYTDIKEFLKIYISIPVEEEHKLTLLNKIGHIRFLGDYLYIQPDQKDKGIYKVLELLNASKKDVFVFGDDYNDMIMFKKEWTNIAMGNACEELKKHATYITKPNIEDGILHACRHFHLIKE